MKWLKVKGKVNTFPGMSGWHWVGVPSDVAKKIMSTAPVGRWRFTSIKVKIGSTEWATSLLPLGEGKFFVAIKAQIRKAEDVFAGDVVALSIKAK